MWVCNKCEYIKDFGTPDRISRVKSDIKLNKIKNLAYSYKTKAVFLDRDGVINKESKSIKTIKNFKIFPSSLLAIKKLNKNKIPCFVVTNQSGLAKGEFTLSDFFKVSFKLDKKLSKIGRFLEEQNGKGKGHSKGGICRKHCKNHMILLY